MTVWYFLLVPIIWALVAKIIWTKKINNQTILIDQCRFYKQDLGYLWSGLWFKITGYPRGGWDTLNKKCAPILSDHAAEVYKTGIDKGVQF